MIAEVQGPALTGRAASRMLMPFEELASTLRSAARGREIAFLQTDGNYGDALIHEGTKAFFEDFALPWRIFDMSSRADKLAALARAAIDRVTGRHGLYVYSGGGGWSHACEVALVNVRRQMNFTRNIVVLPSTVECTLPHMPKTYIRDLHQSRAVLPDAPFCHDMAFYLALVRPDRLLPNRSAPTRRIGLAFRTDNEARIREASAHPENQDISTWGTTTTNIDRFLRHLDQFEHVVTDRLHVAIGATLLGKKVSLVRNSYFKIEAIFRSSIERYFDNCRLIDDDEAMRLVRSCE